jgi:RNA polymerase sigma-70 factor (ECF subfamily)
LELLRASSRHPPIPEEAVDVVDRRVNVEKGVVTREQKDLVRNVLSELATKDQNILRAVFLEEADKAEICERFQVDRDYLRVLVHRAKARFREAFERSGMAQP